MWRQGKTGEKGKLARKSNTRNNCGGGWNTVGMFYLQ